MTDISGIPVEQMREAARAWREHGLSYSCHDRIDDFINEIERLRAEMELWKSRCEAERADHEATQKAWDEDYRRRSWE